MHIHESPECPHCHQQAESARHFLLECSRYTEQRNVMINLLNQITDQPINTELMLSGNEELTFQQNKEIHSAVITFIKNSGRF